MRIEAILTDEIVVADNDGTTTDGVQQFSDQRTLAARIERGTVRQYDQNGELVATADAILVAEPVDDDTLVWPPGADTAEAAEARVPDSVESASSFDGGLTLWRMEI